MHDWKNDNPLDRVRIPWSRLDCYLEFSDVREVPPRLAGFIVTVHQPDLHARTYIDLDLNPHDRSAMSSYFEELARDWRGWHGRKTMSLETLRLECSHDRVGQVELRVSLTPRPWDDDWRVDNCLISIEPGHLEQIATDVRTFLRMDTLGPLT